MAPTIADPDSHPDDPAGRLLHDRYRLTRPIASGGMATVWEAVDQLLSRRVAIKLLHPHLARDHQFVRRFRAEAIASARLSHPCIVAIYDTLTDGSLNAIVMELVVGTNLRADLDQHGPLELPALLAIGTQVADALGTAHASGLVHRDVKPANILLSSDGRVLVADFGIAKAAQGNDLTETGAMVGTAKYLSPEQVTGDPLDGRSDIYSLGIVLYEALTGQPPFVAEGDVATALARLRTEPVPVRTLRPDVPAGVEEVVRRATARRPEDRFPDAESMRRALVAAGAEPARAPEVARAAVAASGEHPPVDRTTIVAAPVAPAPPPPDVPPPPPPPPPSSASERVPDTDPVPATSVPRRRRGRTLLLILVVIAIVVGLAVIGLRAMASEDPVRSLPVTGLTDIDPAGDGENPHLLPNLVDGDHDTIWASENYRSGPEMDKGGVGIAVSLDDPHELEELVLISPSVGWDATFHISDRPTAPPVWEEWDPAVAEVSDVDGGTVKVRLGGRTGKHVLVWFTRLAPIDDRNHGIELAELDLRGR